MCLVSIGFFDEYQVIFILFFSRKNFEKVLIPLAGG